MEREEYCIRCKVEHSIIIEAKNAEQALEEAKDMDLDDWNRFPGPIVVESVGKQMAPLVWPHTPDEI